VRLRYYDWIDALLLALGFVGAATLVGATGKGDLIFVVLAPIALRRIFIGLPPLTEPRTGADWSLISMFGLLAMIGGTGVLAMSGWLLVDRIEHDRAWWNVCEGIAAGAVFMLAGALCLRARYPRVDPAIPRVHLTRRGGG
jgi:hypothetical protein